MTKLEKQKKLLKNILKMQIVEFLIAEIGLEIG